MAKRTRKSTPKKVEAQAPSKPEETMTDTEVSTQPVNESAPERARDEDGTFMADDPSTPDVNEAYVGGTGPDAPDAESFDEELEQDDPTAEIDAAEADAAEGDEGEDDQSDDESEQEDSASEEAEVPAEVESSEAVSQELDRMTKALDGYTNVMSGMIVQAASLKAGAMALHTAAYVMAQFPTDEVLGFFLDFHKKHADGLMAENKALRGTDYLAPGQAPRVEYMYSLFRNLVTGRSTPIDEAAFIKAFANIPNSDAQSILAWVEKRAKANKKKKK